MKTCPNCKKQYADNVAVCPDDGTFLDLETPVVETEPVAETVVPRADEIPHAAETVDRMGTAAAETFERDTEISTAAATAGDRLSSATFSETEDVVGDDYRENPMLGWLLPIIIVILLIILGYWFCSKPAAPTASTSGAYLNKIENKSI
jgi:hypothetical protein